MDLGSRYLLTSVGRAVSTANAHTPLAHTGPGSALSFANGWPVSELPLGVAASYGVSAAVAVARGAHRSRAGRVGLALTAGSAAGLLGLHRRSADAEELVELALVDELGAEYHGRLAQNPLAPTTDRIPLFALPTTRRRYVEQGHLAYGEHGRRTTLDVWRRRDLPVDGRAPVLVQVHGGAWMVGDKEGQGYPLMTHMAERGWVCVSITYRLSPRATWPDHIVDVKRALAWVKANIADHGGDPDWVAITGGSAGGHLSALAAVTPNDPQFQPDFEDADTSVRAAVPFYGIYDWTNRDGTGRLDTEVLLSRRVVKGRRKDDPDLWDAASPMSHVGSDTPPMMFLHGANDTLVPVEQARSMVDLTRKATTRPVVYVEFPGAQHAFDMFGSRRTRAAIAGVERFLNAVRAEDRIPDDPA